jgi:hypothetical protein
MYATYEEQDNFFFLIGWPVHFCFYGQTAIESNAENQYHSEWYPD